MQDDAKPVAWLYENEEGSKELILNCNSEYARRLLEFGYSETPLYAHPPAPAQPELVERVRDAIARRMRPGLFLGSPEMQHKAARPLSVEAAKERILANAADYARAALAAMPVGGDPDAATGCADDFLPGNADDWRASLTPPADADAGLVELLREAREYVTDALDAMHHTDGVDLLARIDAALGQGGVR